MPPLRQEGPPLPPSLGHNPSWTSGDVLLWLKRAFKTDPRTRSAAEIRPVNWPNDYLDIADREFSKKRDILLERARCWADRESFQKIIQTRRCWGSSSAVYRLRVQADERIAVDIEAAISFIAPQNYKWTPLY